MNIKMTINSQLSTIESKKQTKQTSRTETESQTWRTLGWWPVGRGASGIMRDKVKGLRSANSYRIAMGT